MRMYETVQTFYGLLLILLCSSSIVKSRPIDTNNYEIHEIHDHSSMGWKKGSRLDKDKIIPIQIALRENNVDKMYEYVMEVSDPKSDKYGKHWKPKDVLNTFSPSEETWNEVSNWLKTKISFDRLDFYHGSGGWITFDATVEEVEILLQTEYFIWSHEITKKETFGISSNYSLSSHIRDYIDFVLPTFHFGSGSGRFTEDYQNDLVKSLEESEYKKRSSSLPSNVEEQLQECDKFTTPACLRALYSIPILKSTIETNPNNSLSIIEFNQQVYNGEDLDLFFANYSTEQKNKRPKLVSINGGTLNESLRSYEYNSEADLDLSIAMTLVNPIPVSVYQIGSTENQKGTNNVLLHALDLSYCKDDNSKGDGVNNGTHKRSNDCGHAPLTQVILETYSKNEMYFTPSFERRQCNEYAKLALMGTTVVHAQSDDGVAGDGGKCYDSKTQQFNDGSFGRFLPGFPATCPYVLSVGATEILPNNSVNEPESGWSVIRQSDNKTFIKSSGGGFSDVFSLPDYQKKAIENYFNNNQPSYSSAQYNNSRKSRGIPDISANGANFINPVNNKVYQISGTSASAPVIASILTLINEERLNKGLSTVGFVNPALYANPLMFNDIKNGSNPGCGTNGFSAVDGWDPLTGMGTPDFPKMFEYFLNLK